MIRRQSIRNAPPPRSARHCRPMRSSSAISACNHNWLLSFCKPKRPDSNSIDRLDGFRPHGFWRCRRDGRQICAPDRPCVSVCGGRRVFSCMPAYSAPQSSTRCPWYGWSGTIYAYASIRGLQRGYLGGRELATDFKNPITGERYNPDFAAMARSAGVEGSGSTAPPISATPSVRELQPIVRT